MTPTNTIQNTATPGHFECTVIDNRALSRRYYLLVLSRPVGMPNPDAGTFVHLLVPDANRFYLRRPFSVLDSDDDTLSLLIVEKGEGTQIMRRLEKGRTIDMVGPLGSTFPKVPGKRVMALGGGVGLAPLYHYGVHREVKDCETYRLLYGARNREDLFVDAFDWALDGVLFSSDDGSHGFKGNIVEFAQHEFEKSPVDVIFSCGPNPMLKAVAAFADRVGVPHYVSLENRMACGLGACRSCVVLTRNGDSVLYRTVCHDGPVFDAGELVWDELPQA